MHKGVIRSTECERSECEAPCTSACRKAAKYLVAAVLALAACSGSTPKTPDAGLGSNLAFGAKCSVVSDTSTECTSGVCTNTIDQLGYPVCSQKCTVLGGTDTTCPSGSMGQKCNMKGYCRP